MKASPEVKQQMIRHLKDVVKLLQVSKSIAETKLDEKDMHVVSITDLGSLTLPKKLEHNIDLMAQVINDQMPVINEKVNAIVTGGPSSEVCIDNLPIERAVNVFQQWVKVAALAKEDAKSEKYYGEQLELLKDEFQKSMKQIDDKSAFLRDVATKVNTACSDDEIKQGLFSLTGSHEIEWNDAEWDEFLSGKKELRI